MPRDTTEATERSIKISIKRFALSGLALLSFTGAAHANAGWFWLIMPAAAVYWWVVILPFALEWGALWKRFELSLGQAFKVCLAANALSTLAGTLLGFTVGVALDTSLNISFMPMPVEVVILGVLLFLLVTSLVNLVIEYWVILRWLPPEAAPLSGRPRLFIFGLNVVSGATTLAMLFMLDALEIT